MSDKIVYIADVRLPTDKAHGIQIMKMCEAFAESGVQVSLWVPKRYTPIGIDAFAYYGVQRKFTIVYVPCIDFTHQGKFGFMIQSLTFLTAVLWKSLRESTAFFYTRSAVVGLGLSVLHKKVGFEAHMGHAGFALKKLISLNAKIIVISNGLKNFFVSLGAKESSILVAPDAVNRQEFNSPLSKDDAHKKLGINTDKKVVLYTGHLYSWKGAETLAQSADMLPENTQIIFVGGTQGDVADFKSRYHSEKILFLGKKPHSEIPLYLRSADVLVIPNSAKEDISRLYTSPMKLFEYMASGVPIVSANLPSLREIVNEETVTFFTPDDAHSLALSIGLVIERRDESVQKANHAFELVKNYSWMSRAMAIRTFVSLPKV